MPSLNLPEKPHTIDGIMRDLDARFGHPPDHAQAGQDQIPASRENAGEFGADCHARLGRLAEAASVKPDYRIRSHRPVIGRLTDLIKKIIHWGSRPYIDELIERQERFNAESLALLGALSTNVMALNERTTRHSAEIRNVQDFQNELARRHDVGSFFDDVPREKRLELMDRFRGTFDEIWGRHHIYLDDLRDRPGKILDLGCGRGEFLHMLRHEGIESWGCEIDPLMLELARDRDLSVVQGDALGVLNTVEDASLGGIFASQVAEHLFPGELLRLVKLARKKIAPGGVLILETLNPKSLAVLAKSYYKDLDHKKAIDPDYLAALIELAGFTNATANLTMPFTDSDALAPLPPASELGLDEATRSDIESKFERISSAIWGYQDYYVIGEVPNGAEASGDRKSGAAPSKSTSSTGVTSA